MLVLFCVLVTNATLFLSFFFFNYSRNEKPRFPNDGGSRRFGGRDSLYPARGPGGPGGPGGNTMAGGLMPPSSSPQHSSVLMAYNLPMTKINCDKLFNLLCLYGNVSKVSFGSNFEKEKRKKKLIVVL